MSKNMKYFLCVVSTLLVQVLSLKAQDVQVVKAEDFLDILETPSTKHRLVNFWATWCGPCVAELPHFEEVRKSNESVLEVIYVSLDMVEKLKSKVKPFIAKKRLGGTLYLLDETDLNDFISAVNKQWTGSIPATILISPNGDSAFKEGSFTMKELDKFVNENVKQ